MEAIRNWVTLLESNSSANVQLALALAEGMEITDAMLGLLCITYHKWQKKPDKKSYYDYHLFQCNQLEWENREKDDLIAQQISQLIASHSSSPVSQLLASAQIFYLIYPEPIYIGNADCGGYTGDADELFKQFLSYAFLYDEALKISEKFTCEYITLSQILWAYFRWFPWGPGSYAGGCFSKEAAGYFLKKAVSLEPALPVHYIFVYTKQPYWDECKSEYNNGNLYELKSKNGITFFYYAQFCQYHLVDFEKAICYYKKFIEAEPNLLPDNSFKLYFDEANKRFFMPSVQEALTEISKIYFEQSNLKDAAIYLSKAIACRPDYYQTPYELLAALYLKQGNMIESLINLAKKVEVIEKSNQVYYGENNKYYCYFNYQPVTSKKQHKPTLSIQNDYNDTLQVTFINSLLLQIADSYLFELFDYQQAGTFYKKALNYCSPEQKTGIIENQIRMAIDLKDYWQAKHLAEKLLRTHKNNKTASLYLQKTKEILGY